MTPIVPTTQTSRRPLWTLALLAMAGVSLVALEVATAAAQPLLLAQADTSEKPKATKSAGQTAAEKIKTTSKPAVTKPIAGNAKLDARAQASPDAKANAASSAAGKAASTKKDQAPVKPAAAPAKPAGKATTNAPKPSAKPLAKATAAGVDTAGAPVDPVPPSRVQAQSLPAAATTSVTAPAMDVSAVKRALEMVRSRKQSDASEVRNTIADSSAKKLVEWVILRSDDSGADFARYVAFINANPNWPSIVTLRRKAEAAAWQDQPSPSAVTSYFAQNPPLSSKGRFAFARALLANNNRRDAEGQVREAWRYETFSEDVESRAMTLFGELITRDDHKARMTRRLYEKDDTEAGMRAANRLGGNEPLIAKARISMLNKGSTKAAMDAVPAAARNDIGYKFAQVQMLRRADQFSEALAVLKTVPQLDRSHDLDEWWVERRVLAREFLDAGNAKDAYIVARDATVPERSVYKSEHQFMAGWIALRYLDDPATAEKHFLKISDAGDNPISVSRGGYWSGRAAEAQGKTQLARQHYQEAAKYPTAYYGQLARAKLGLSDLNLNPLPALSSSERSRATSSDVVRAVELLYAVDARDLTWTALADLGDKSTDPATLLALAELAAKYKDARGMLLVGKLSLARGFPLDHAAFPNFGVPDYTPIGPTIEPAFVYAIVRQESWFNPKTVSSANALGLMQVTPAAGKYIAGKFKAPFDQAKLLSDQTYNVQMGSAELADVVRDYRGSYIMAFAAYNAGRGRVKTWLAKYGDPRDPDVDPVDWVERIPFSETRNYVQRVLENAQVYRVRFGGSTKLMIEADLKRGSESN